MCHATNRLPVLTDIDNLISTINKRRNNSTVRPLCQQCKIITNRYRGEVLEIGGQSLVRFHACSKHSIIELMLVLPAPVLYLHIEVLSADATILLAIKRACSYVSGCGGCDIYTLCL